MFLLIGCALSPPSTSSQSDRWCVDHHMHAGSATVVAAIRTFCRQAPTECPPELPAPSVSTARNAVEALDDGGVRRGVILSEAYFFGMPDLASKKYDVARLTRAENLWVAQQVAHYRTRLTGFFSVDP